MRVSNFNLIRSSKTQSIIKAHNTVSEVQDAIYVALKGKDTETIGRNQSLSQNVCRSISDVKETRATNLIRDADTFDMYFLLK